MLVSRRLVASTIAAVFAVLTACTSSSSTSSSGSERSESSEGSAGPADAVEEPDDSSSERPTGREQQDAPAERMWDTSPSSVAAIGDSITRGFDTCALLADCPEASWATGTDAAVDSLAMQLLGDDGDDIADRSWNLAETGASVTDLTRQARRAAEHEPELVTIMIGANDACAPDVASMTSVADFEEDFAAAVGVLREESPRTQIYVSSVPDLMRLWREGSESLMARAVWQMANICPSMLSDPDNEAGGARERREAVRERVQAYNGVLAEICAADSLCRYDGGAVFDYEFTTDHLSDWDWFHPGEAGQRQLAALAYEQVATDVAVQ